MLDRDQERYPPTTVLLSNGRQVTLQGLSLEDAGPLGDFHESLPRATYRFYGPYPLTRQSAARLAAEAGSPTLVALVAKTAGEIVGHAWYRWVDEDSRTSTFGICLRQEYRGIGLGRAMMERLLYIGEQNGPAVMSLTVQKANPRALALYHSMGFCEKREQMVPERHEFAAEPEYYMERQMRGCDGTPHEEVLDMETRSPRHNADQIEKWGLFELALPGPAEGNPYIEVALSARFAHQGRVLSPEGFYDGDGIYRVRFMPDAEGEWTYETRSNRVELDGVQGAFCCAPPSSGNHGPVRVSKTHHFCYADGAPHVSVGTTCYAWAHQGDALEAQTLQTLQRAPFNKMRMCVFPKDYVYNRNEPTIHPFRLGEDGQIDPTQPDPAFFRRFEGRVADLLALGIEADLILFHPYDRWGYAHMAAGDDDRYLRYVVARLAAYRNVWWSMANEYDFMRDKSLADWDRFFHIVRDCDPYGHLRSVHNGHTWYDHTQPWVTHASVQTGEMARGIEWRNRYQKPVVFDEVCYEGDIPRNWGNISAQELVHRFWAGTAAGCYVGHGETYEHGEDVLWWSKGGVLHGESPPRIAFLRQILEDAPVQGLNVAARGDLDWRRRREMAYVEGEFYLLYTGVHQPARKTLDLPEDVSFRIDVLDTWEMTISPLPGVHSGAVEVELPAKPYMAIRATRSS